MDVADSPDAFVAACTARAVTRITPTQAAARQRLQHESWSRKAEIFAQLIYGEAPSAHAE